MRRASLVALLTLVSMPHFAHAQETGGSGLSGFIDSLQLAWRPEPHDTEPFNQPMPMNGVCILNYYTVDAVILHRSSGSFNGDMDWSVGPRVVLGRGMSDQDAFEVGYFAQYQMNGSFFNAGSAGPFANPREDYRSEFNSFEINYRHWFLPELSVIAGFRYINWHEDLDGAVDTPPGSFHFSDHTSNNLFGFQTGADFKHRFNDRFGIELGGRAGIYGNRAQLDGATGFTTADWQTAFVGELSVVGTYNVTTYLKLRAGYEAMWVDGMALAPDQAILPGPINSRGSVFLHGAIVGFELQW